MVLRAAVWAAALLLCAQPLAALERDVSPDALGATGLPSADAPKPPEAAPAMRVIPDNYADAVGTWDLSIDGSNNRCQIVLSSENSKNGRIVRFPAGCRRALPVLAQTMGWLFADGGIRLVDKDIRPLLKFSASKDRSSLTAKAESGKVYALVPLQTVAMLPPTLAEPASVEATSAALAPMPGPDSAAAAALRGAEPTAASPEMRNAAGAIPGSQPVLPSGALVPSANAASGASGLQKAAATSPAGSSGPVPTPGVYALDRFNDKDVCRLELEPGRTAAKGADMLSAAHILPGCRDSGIATFEPVSWRYANGHITLKAKRGHAVNLVPTGEGSWRRDPDVGTTFVLRKVER